MRTERIAQLELETTSLASDLAALPTLAWSRAYSHYICGGPWLSCMLWTSDGGTGDGVLTHYQGKASASWTEQALKLPAVRRLVERNFHLKQLKFVRLAILQPGSVIIPHRDLLELEAPLHRIHVPLVTDEHCLFTERNIVYRMRRGEVWFMDASDVHSVACFSSRDRVHLILDFDGDASASEFMSMPWTPGDGIPADCVVDRPRILASERAALLGLASILDERNHLKIVELVIHQHYRSDGGADFIWTTLLDIAARAPNARAAGLLRDAHRYFLMERSEVAA